MAPPIRFIRAELAVDEVMAARHDEGVDFGLDGWAGVNRTPFSLGDQDPYLLPARMVTTEFVVPEVTPLEFPAFPENMTVGFWTGIDGEDGAGGNVLQAGVAARVVPWGDGLITSFKADYWAWTEWYTDEYKTPPVKVKGFPVEAGDLINITVSAGDTVEGAVFMHNYRTGVGVSVAMTADSGIRSTGFSCEWEVEAGSEHLPYFEPVIFSNCAGGSFVPGAEEYFTLLPGSYTSEIYRQQGDSTTLLTETTFLSPNSAEIRRLAVD